MEMCVQRRSSSTKCQLETIICNKYASANIYRVRALQGIDKNWFRQDLCEPLLSASAVIAQIMTA